MPPITSELRGKLPHVGEPVPFHDAASGLHGWKLAIPGGRPLATPAVVDGRIYLGGGFGSYDFFALDAHTGRVAWQYQTNDDGPTAAVVAEGHVAFNTESCELEVLTLEGRAVWKKWLGDPLMSMPAIAAGRVYMVYPDSRGDRRHYLACFGLTDGTEVWRQPIPGEIITAPVLAEGKVYIANLDGSLGCYAQADGRPEWHEERQATSSPVVFDGQCYFSQRKEMPLKATAGEAQQMEYVASKLSVAGTDPVAFAQTESKADYLDHGKRRARSPYYQQTMAHDAGVGFGSHKGDAKMHQSRGHLGHDHVSSLWAYQGSKPFLARGRLYSAMGDTVHCADSTSREVLWKRRLSTTPESAEVLDNVLTPPAVVNGKLFFGSIEGDVWCVGQDDGEVRWRCSVGEPVLFQPAVVEGRVYVPTRLGSLLCLETGDPADDGWAMWGGNAHHNGLV